MRVVYDRVFDYRPQQTGIAEVVFEYPNDWTHDQFRAWLEERLAEN